MTMRVKGEANEDSCLLVERRRRRHGSNGEAGVPFLLAILRSEPGRRPAVGAGCGQGETPRHSEWDTPGPLPLRRNPVARRDGGKIHRRGGGRGGRGDPQRPRLPGPEHGPGHVHRLGFSAGVSPGIPALLFHEAVQQVGPLSPFSARIGHYREAGTVPRRPSPLGPAAVPHLCRVVRPGDARAVRSGRRCHPCRAAIGGRRSLVRATLQGPAVLPCQIEPEAVAMWASVRGRCAGLRRIPTSKRATRNGKRSTPQGRSPMQRAGFSARWATAASIPRSPGSSKFTTSPAAAKRRWTWPDAGNASNGSGAETRVRPAS